MRGIFNSCGSPTVEIEMHLQGGTVACASAPAAIAPGKRERQTVTADPFARKDMDKIQEIATRRLGGKHFDGQRAFDLAVADMDRDHEFGSEVTLGLSLAYFKADAKSARRSPLEAMLVLTGRTPSLPTPLVNIFSGGIHDPHRAQPFQQIMILPRGADFLEQIRIAIRVFDRIHTNFEKRPEYRGLSSSSGIVTSRVPSASLFDMILDSAAREGVDQEVSIAVDVAAEHLRAKDGRYQYDKDLLNGEELIGRLEAFVADRKVTFIEDPFHPDDTVLWKRLRAVLGDRAVLIGDDIFATDLRHLDVSLADGMIVKMNQIGSLTDALDASSKAKEHGMVTCVSHRSCETEETIMAELAVATNAEYVKIGGPRRGDRIAKYNQLLRLMEQVEERENPAFRDATA